MTEAQIVEIVQREVARLQKDLDGVGRLNLFGNWSQKRLGEIVGQALINDGVVVIDGRQLKSVSGKRTNR